MTDDSNPPSPRQPGWTQPPPAAPDPSWTPPVAPPPGQGWVPPGSASQAPPKKGGIRKRWIAIGAVVAFVGVGGFAAWQREQTYQTGHTAYLAGDCATAVGPLRSAAGEDASSGDSDTELKARAELQECEALLAANDLATQGADADAVLAYRDLITKYPRSPLVASALASGQDLIAAAPEEVATEALCDELGPLEAQEFIASPAETLPALLFACGRVYEAERSYADALAAYARFRAEFADHRLAGDVEAAYARTILAETDASGAGALPPPIDSGSAGGVAGQATIVIQNDSPDSLALVFSGPDVRVEEIEPCAECQKFIGSGPPACPELGPIAEYIVAPGAYDVVVRSGSGSDVTPFRGTWTLEAGQVYESCFYIVTTSR